MSTPRKRSSAEVQRTGRAGRRKGHKTSHERVSLYGVHPTQITPWTPQLQQEVPQMFSARRATHEPDQEALQAQ